MFSPSLACKVDFFNLEIDTVDKYTILEYLQATTGAFKILSILGILVQVTVLVVGLLTARHCSTSPLLPVVSLLQDMPMEGMEMMPMMTSEPMMTAMGEL